MSSTPRRSSPLGLLALLLPLLASAACAAPPAGATPHTPEERPVKIRLIVDGETLTATLADNPTARDFLALLPLELTLEDYARTEKISDLPRKLTTQGAPPGLDPAIGDLTYYAPWGNLAIFYRDFRYAEGLVPLARLDGGVEALTRHAGRFTARIEPVEDKR